MLYYPHYTPSRERLRSILLFSDQISLIVPRVDQFGVEQRGHIRELLEVDERLISFKDPQWKYRGWANQNGVPQIVENLVDEISAEVDADNLDRIATDRFGNVDGGQDSEIAFLWAQKGWKYVAAEKLPDDLHDIFFKDGLALRVGHFCNPLTNQIIEHNGVLCHPKLADFVLARMAREASFQEGLPSITFGGLDFVNHLFDDSAGVKYPDHVLLQTTMDLLVPDGIHQLTTVDFLHIREDFLSVRRAVTNYLDIISKEHHLNLDHANSNVFLAKLTSARRKIETELKDAERFVGDQVFRSRTLMAFEAAATMSLAALGAHYGGPTSAAIATGVGIAGVALANRMSTLGVAPDGSALSVAMAKAKIKKGGRPSRWSAPSYWKG